MQSVPGAIGTPWVRKRAHQDQRHFANPSVGWANFPLRKAAREAHASLGGSIKRLPASVSDVDWTWRAMPRGNARLTVFISVSASDMRTPMNSPLRSARPEKRPRETGFDDEGCCLI
ncbi:hypothetical protein [Paraburkholderia sp. SOS3]|uniref:hypothetical protein n=1 Tax=Paraburkholderia sp. SOS3 TaxID=1926494 RepID=UPI0009474531|nr:hypothetical protein [Paraburkholderia sp. SOS3]APR36998.1 hypothetical protein BTO02_18120 [Paraburkholderia sp. SOS3]